MIEDNPCLQVCVSSLKTETHDGTPFVGNGGPDATFKDIGFFVRRPFLAVSEFKACSKIEVQHVMTDFAGGETGVSWFFHAVGSGIYVDCHSLPALGEIKVYTSRKGWMDDNSRWWVGDKMVQHDMESNSVAMMIFTQADLTIWPQISNGENPRAEIVIRHAEADSSELESERGSCLDDEAIKLKFYTGVDTQVACKCAYNEESAQDNFFINCDATAPAPAPV